MTDQGSDSTARPATKKRRKKAAKKKATKKKASKKVAKKKRAKKKVARKKKAKVAAATPEVSPGNASEAVGSAESPPPPQTAATHPETAATPPETTATPPEAAEVPAQEIVLGAIIDVRDIDLPEEEPVPVEHHLTPQGPGHRGERRCEERHEVPGLIEVQIELFGYQRDAREFGIGPTPDVDKKIHSEGTTVNLSLGGMLARIADPVTEGSYCLVHFVNAGENVQPELRWGVALRCDEVEPGSFEIAVQFSSPLEHLDADALVAA